MKKGISLSFSYWIHILQKMENSNNTIVQVFLLSNFSKNWNCVVMC
jgi:hypothetical protein